MQVAAAVRVTLLARAVLVAAVQVFPSLETAQTALRIQAVAAAAVAGHQASERAVMAAQAL